MAVTMNGQRRATGQARVALAALVAVTLAECGGESITTTASSSVFARGFRIRIVDNERVDRHRNHTQS